MQNFPCSKIGEIYKNPEYNIAYIGHIGIEFGDGLVISKYSPLPKNVKPSIYHKENIIGKVRYTNHLKRNDYLYGYTTAFDFEDNDILVPTFLLKKVQCITCERIMAPLDTPCKCIETTPILIIHDYQLVGCELCSDLNYTNVGSNRNSILIDFFKNEYSFLEIYDDYAVSDGDKWCQRINIDIDI